MPYGAPRICSCGKTVAFGKRCQCQIERAAKRNAYFDRQRPNARERGYDTKWQRESKAYLSQHPVCCRCGDSSHLVDHITPHKGDKRLFWSRSNWQALCHPCHNGWKQALERNTDHADG